MAEYLMWLVKLKFRDWNKAVEYKIPAPNLESAQKWARLQAQQFRDKITDSDFSCALLTPEKDDK